MVISNLHLKVLNLLGQERKGRILDAPAGTGELSCLLKEKNFDILAADINQDVFKCSGIEFLRVDLNKDFPFTSEFFDHAICVEGIEHLQNPHQVISEFSRVIKYKGSFILTTPNILNVFSRLRYLLTGHYEYFGDYFANQENFYVFHINPVGFPELERILENNNFKIEKITSNQSILFKKGIFSILTMLFLLPLIIIVSKFKVKDQRLKKILLSRELLFGELLILKCRRN